MGLGANPQQGISRQCIPHGPWLPPALGKYSRESKPVANLLVLVSFTSKFTSVLTNITSKFADNRRIDRMGDYPSTTNLKIRGELDSSTPEVIGVLLGSMFLA